MNHKASPLNFWLWALFLIFIVYGSLIPFQIAAQFPPLPNVITHFLEAPKDHISKMDVITNFSLYIPFGFLTALLILRHRKNFLLAITAAFTLSGIVSLGIEIAQAYMTQRSSSIMDFYLNAAGGAAGGAIAAFSYSLWNTPRITESKIFLQKRPLLALTITIGILIFLGGLLPFNFSIQISDLKNAVKTIQWIPFAAGKGGAEYYVNLAINFFLFMLFTALLHISAWAYQFQAKLKGLSIILLTTGLAGAIEFFQLFIVSRSPNVTDIVTGLLAAITGIFFAVLIEGSAEHYRAGERSKSTDKTFIPLPETIKTFILIVYSIYIALLLLAPFHFNFALETAGGKIGWSLFIPFYAYWVHYDLFTFQTFLFKSLIYVPWGGFLYACFHPSVSARSKTLGGTFLLAITIEFFRFFHLTRNPDITNLLTALLGSVIGIWFIRNFFLKTPGTEAGLRNTSGN